MPARAVRQYRTLLLGILPALLASYAGLIPSPAFATPDANCQTGAFQDADTLFKEGVAAFGKGVYDTAIIKFEAALAQGDFDDQPPRNGATAETKPGSSPPATLGSPALSAGYSKRALAYFLLGTAYRYLQQNNKAIDALTEYLKLKPNDLDALLGRAHTYYDLWQTTGDEKAKRKYAEDLQAARKASGLPFVPRKNDPPKEQQKNRKHQPNPEFHGFDNVALLKLPEAHSAS